MRLQQAGAISVALVKAPVGLTPKLFVRVCYADTGEVMTEFRSPFQRPTFYKIVATAFDSDGDGLADAMKLTARRTDTNRLVRRIRFF